MNSTGTPSSSIRGEVGSSSRDDQPRHVKIVHAGGVAAGDLSFMHYDLGFIDLEQKTLQPLDNPFGTGLSPRPPTSSPNEAVPNLEEPRYWQTRLFLFTYR